MQSFYFCAYFQEEWKYMSKEHAGRSVHEQQLKLDTIQMSINRKWEK